MLKKWLEKVRQYVAGPVGEENEELKALLVEARKGIAALNAALTQTHQSFQDERYEKLLVVGALALQGGGTIVLPNPFIETVKAGNYVVRFSQSEDKQAVVISLEDLPQEQPPGPAPAQEGPREFVEGHGCDCGDCDDYDDPYLG